jgi:sugar (pentulose or hexulose) kinase
VSGTRAYPRATREASEARSSRLQEVLQPNERLDVRLGRRFEPDPTTAAAYARSFALYNDLYAALAPLFRRYAH